MSWRADGEAIQNDRTDIQDEKRAQKCAQEWS